MNEINEMVHKALEKKMSDGSFEKILSDYVDKAIKSTMDEMFKKSWRPESEPHGAAYEYVNASVAPMIMKALESCSLKDAAEKTRAAIDNIIAQSSITELGNAMSKYVGLFSSHDDIESFQKYPLRKVLNEYVKEIEGMTYHFDRDWFTDHGFDLEEGMAYLNCSMHVEDIMTSNYSKISDRKLVTLIVGDDYDDRVDDDCTISFFLVRDYKDRWKVDCGSFQPLGLDELGKMGPTNMLIRALSYKYAEITDIHDDEKDAEFRDLYE